MKVFEMMGLKISTVTAYKMTEKITGDTFYAEQPLANTLHAAGTHTTSRATEVQFGHLEYPKAGIDWWINLAPVPQS